MDIIKTIFELSIFAVGAISALLAIISSFLTMTGKYAAEVTPIVRLSKFCACVFLISPLIVCLFDDSWQLYKNMSSACGLYTMFAAAWAVVFVVSALARLVARPGKHREGEPYVRPGYLHISALFFLCTAVVMSWLFS